MCTICAAIFRYSIAKEEWNFSANFELGFVSQPQCLESYLGSRLSFQYMSNTVSILTSGREKSNSPNDSFASLY